LTYLLSWFLHEIPPVGISDNFVASLFRMAFFSTMSADADDDLVMSIIDFTYPDILDNISDPSYFQEKAILAPMNEVADAINEKLLEKF
ncbi:ATP-dependent DNA helicase PIF1-like protein, partial [Tanacetum coccineum]